MGGLPIVAGRYAVVGEIYRDLSCTLYEAEDTVAGQRVGLRRVHSEAASDTLVVKQAYRKLAEVVHPNLVRTRELIEDEGRWFCVQEHVPGLSWDRWVAKRLAEDPQDLDWLREAARQILRALRALHDVGRVYGGLSAGSLLVSGDRVVLTHPVLLCPEEGLQALQREEIRAVGGLIRTAMERSARADAEDLERLCRLCQTPEEGAVSAAQALLQLQYATAPTRPSAMFQGRQRELDALRAAWQTARAGRAVGLFVHGAPGIGRSALIEQFIGEIAGEDVFVLRGRSYPRESVPFKAIDALVDDVARWLRALSPQDRRELLPQTWGEYLPLLFPVLGTVASQAAAPLVSDDFRPDVLRQRATSSAIEFFHRVSTRGPLVFVLDDVHWGDADSALLVSALIQGLARDPVLVILSFKSGEDDTPFLRTLLSDPRLTALDIRTLALSPLSSEDSRALVRSAYPDCRYADPELLEHVVHEGRGQPWLTHVLALRACQLRAQGEVPLEEVTLAAHYRAEIRTLPEPVMVFLEALCLAGQPMPADLLARAAGVPEHLSVALSLLERHELVQVRRDHDSEVVFPTQALLAELVVEGVTPARERELHSALALEMTGAGWDEGTISGHWLAAGDQEKAALLAVHGAQRADQALAFGEAARLYQLAIDLGTWNATERARLGTLMGNAYLSARRPVDAARCWIAAAEGAPTGVQFDLQRQAAAQFMFSGHVEEGLQIADSVLERLGVQALPSPHMATLALWWELAVLAWVSRAPRWLVPRRDDVAKALMMEVYAFLVEPALLLNPLYGMLYHVRHLRLSITGGDRWAQVQAYARDATLAATAGRPARARAALAKMDRLAAKEQEQELQGIVALGHGTTTYLLGHPNEAEEFLKDAYNKLYRLPHVSIETGTAQMFYLRTLVLRGDLNLARRLRDQWLDEALDQQNRLFASMLRADMNVLLHLADERPDLGHRDVALSLQGWPKEPWNYVHQFSQTAEVMVLLYEGRPEDALELLAQHVSFSCQRVVVRNTVVETRQHYYRARVVQLSGASAQEVVRSLRVLRSSDMAMARAFAEVVEAEAAALVGDRRGRERGLRAALEVFESLHMLLWAASLQIFIGLHTQEDDGPQLLAAGRSRFANQSVQRPERYAAALGLPTWRE
ncbi:MAG: AAA family ATPase [Deltaproteobacteria bacterium]|nr:AAA family ATPase [Deltaproteobacteria bacterium]